MTNKLNITIATQQGGWLAKLMDSFIDGLRSSGHNVSLVHNSANMQGGDLLFLLSYWKIIPPDITNRYAHSLVVHESKLPEGRGWSPVSWQVIEGINEIPVCLIEACEPVDSGVIYARSVMRLKGTELIKDIRKEQARVTFELCSVFINGYPDSSLKPTNQIGDISNYRRRGPEDSELSTHLSLGQQFDLLRTVDNEDYPAFFEYRGVRYKLMIEKFENHF